MQPNEVFSKKQYLATLVSREGKRYYYDVDATSGPMATGAPYWSTFEHLNPLTAKEAFEVAEKPSIGWGGLQVDGAVVELFEISYTQVPSPEVAQRRREAHREAGLAKLTDEEKQALGIGDA